MRKDKKECKKGQESTIGKIIYGFLLFMPLLAIGTTCLISTFNMSAKEETEIHYKYETNEVNSVNDLVADRVYHLDSFRSLDIEHNYNEQKEIYINIVKCEEISFVNDAPYVDELYIYEYDSSLYSFITLGIRYKNNYNFASYSSFSNSNGYVSLQDTFESFELVNVDFFIDENSLENFITDYVIPTYNLPTISDYNVIESVETHNLNAEDIFYRSVDKVTQSPLFNWAENSIIYTTMSSTCTALSITTPFIPLLMSYWLIISVIYFLYDIALMLIWLIHRKIHELQETI